MASMLGQRLKDVRQRRGLSQGQVAKYAGVAQSTLSELERGEIAPKTVDALVNLAGYFGLSADYLLGITNDARPKGERNVSPETLALIELINSLPEAKREPAIALIRAIIALAETGVEEVDPPQSEPVVAREGGGVTMPSPTEREVQEMLQAKQNALLEQLRRMLPADQFEAVRRSVEAGRPLTDAEIDSIVQASGQQPLQQSLQLINDGDAGFNG